MREQVVNDVLNAGKVAGGGVVIWQLTPEQFAALATGAYFTIMAAYTAWKWVKEWMKSRKG